ncbi:MAG: hydroxyethylthiazole kinase [Peptococcaceae bacterium]|nr:hydroxyethylthiazole kinase [Peptococcaceae bacterium]
MNDIKPVPGAAEFSTESAAEFAAAEIVAEVITESASEDTAEDTAEGAAAVFGRCLEEVRESQPLVQVITNFVTVNDCANILLAAGASPTMARDIREAAEIAEGCQALVLNMGAVENTEAMLLAGRRAGELKRPVILDPVAAGASSLRRQISRQLLSGLDLTVIRGNISEIRALALGASSAKGVDAAAGDLVTEESLPRTVDMAKAFAKKAKTVVAISGKIDIVTDGKQVWLIRNGCPTMARITGSGCMLTALIGAFCGANPRRPFEATAAAVAAMGLAGQLAENRRQKNGTGTATFRNDLIDAVSNMTAEELTGGALIERY